MSASAASYQCMFCRLRATEKSEEHPILNALGGTLSRSRMTCGDCNNGTGSGIDAEFLKALEWVTTIVNPKNRRRPAKRLRKLTTAEGDLMSIGPGGDVRVEQRRLPDGRWVGAADDAERLTASAEAAAKAESKRQGVEVSVGTEFGEVYNPTFHFEIRLDGHVAFRSAVKSALESLAIATSNGLFVPEAALDPFRDYVLNGAETFPSEVGYLTNPVLPELLASLEHSVFLCQRADGSVYFEVSTYGGIVSIAGVLPAIEKRFRPWLYRVDPVTGAHSVSHPAVAPPELENWSTDPGSDHQQRMKDAMNRVSALWQRRGDEGRVDRIFNEAWTEVMTEPGKPINQDHVDRLSRIIAGRTVEFMAKTKRLG